MRLIQSSSSIAEFNQLLLNIGEDKLFYDSKGYIELDIRLITQFLLINTIIFDEINYSIIDDLSDRVILTSTNKESLEIKE